jgi:rubrerythrin
MFEPPDAAAMAIARPGREASPQTGPAAQRRTAKDGFPASRGMSRRLRGRKSAASRCGDARPGPDQARSGCIGGGYRMTPNPGPSVRRSPGEKSRAIVATRSAPTRAGGAKRAKRDMTERPRRPILHLKAGTVAPAKTAAPGKWRCKPCGAVVEPGPELDDDDEVRCGACGAVLGRAGQFRSDPPQLQRIRARRVGG